MAIADVLGGRARFPVHLQAQIIAVRPAASLHSGIGCLLIEAQVLRVFRGNASAGDALAIKLQVRVEGEQVPAGDFLYDRDTVAAAKFIEVFLEEREGGLWLVSNSYSGLIDRPSELPQLEQGVSPELRRRPWWRRLLGLG